jgi:hypothetical protein
MISDMILTGLDLDFGQMELVLTTAHTWLLVPSIWGLFRKIRTIFQEPSFQPGVMPDFTLR